MNPSPTKARWRRWLAWGVFVTVLGGAMIAFRVPLIAWFTGKEMKGSGVGTAASGTTSTGSSAASSAQPTTKPIEYPPPAFDAVRSAIDASERIRAALTQDQMTGVTEAASTLAQALRAAASATSEQRKDIGAGLEHAALHVDRLAASVSLDAARKAFAEFNADFLPLLGADSRLTKGLHVFECPMFEHARWVQRGEVRENPYMGQRMPTCGTQSSFQSALSEKDASGDSNAIDHYTCSMHPSVKQKARGKCPICGMDLIPITKAQKEQGVVMIDEARRQLIGVRVAPVVEAPLQRAFRAVGQVTYDESKLTDVTIKVRGFITKLLVNRTGQRVKAGQPLFQLFSPDVFSAEQDFLLATQGSTAGSGGVGSAPGRLEMLGRAARQRLHLLGLGDAQIDALHKKGVPSESVTFPSPASGFVIEKNVVEGASVEAGMRLYRIAALDKVWVEAEVYEGDLSHVRVGQSATVTLDYLPGRSYEATVSTIYPYLDPTSRTGRVRIELANKELELRPGMFASVHLASASEPSLQVPASAVVYTGPRRLVFLDLGEGRFRPQEVRVGSEANGMYEVLEGLKPGDRVATSGVFLIAAEARISTAAKYWDKAPEGAEPNAAPDPQPTAPLPSAKPAPTNAPVSPSKTAAPEAVFSCPMHPEVRSPTPGKCPKCGMNLERRADGASR